MPSRRARWPAQACLERQVTAMAVRVWEADAPPDTAWSEAGFVGDSACEAAAPST